MPSSFLDVCRFNPTAGGTTDWTYSSAVTGYQSPTAAGAVNGAIYSYRAESNDLSQWEIGTGTYNTGTGVLSRTVVLFNSSGGTSKINFSTVPQVAIVALAEDLLSLFSGKNIIINGGFTINQRGYVSAAALSAGVYAHDRWKAGASGGDYSFTQLASPTTVTVAANKSLIQVVEDKNVVGGSYTLSWAGTATARVTINSATPSGNFAVSPIKVTGQTAGTTMSVEFTGANAAGGSIIATNTGTIGSVQLEAGASGTPFDFRPFPAELAMCLRYFEKSYDLTVAPATASSSPGLNLIYMGTNSLTNFIDYGGPIKFAVQKRSDPTVTLYSYQGTAGRISDASAFTELATNNGGIATLVGQNSFLAQNQSGGTLTTSNLAVTFHWKAESEL
jgi:hypothetical protein